MEPLLEPVCLNCGLIDARFNPYLVVTVVFELEEMREIAQKRSSNNNMHLYVAVKENIMKYSDEELDQHHKNGTAAWQDWCNDVALYFVYRHILFGDRIPIQNIPEGGREATKFYLEKKLEAQEMIMKRAQQESKGESGCE